MSVWQERVWTAAEEFRARYLRGDLAHLPVDVFAAAERIAPRFGVHSQVIETRFDREGLWPSPV